MNNTIEYFKKISAIPRESGNEKAVADYLENFAKEHNLYCYRDSYNNVLIKKENINKKPVILQAHTDMVCVKENNYNFNFSTMPLKLIEKDNFLSAYKTSLGADNGIGVGIILSLLAENNNYNIEAFFTTDEEVTMTGAINFDYSLLKSNKLISLDGFSSNKIICGCASICDMKINFKPEFVSSNKQGFKLEVSGLKGGHSGEDIHKNIGNAINILAEILSSLEGVELSSLQGGKQFNFIPNYASATFASDNFLNVIEEKIKYYKSKYSNINILYNKVILNKFVQKKFSNKVLNILNNIKTGVLVKSDAGNSLVSQNLASVNLEEGLIKINERAHSEELENKQISFLKNLSQNFCFDFSIYDKQVGLVQSNSNLAQELNNVNKKVNNEEMEIITSNISVEGAIFKQKKNNLDIVIISPDIYDVHSTKERVYIPSINKTYNLLQNYLSLQ